MVCALKRLTVSVHGFAGCGGLAGCIEDFGHDEVGFERREASTSGIEDYGAEIG